RDAGAFCARRVAAACHVAARRVRRDRQGARAGQGCATRPDRTRERGVFPARAGRVSGDGAFGTATLSRDRRRTAGREGDARRGSRARRRARDLRMSSPYPWLEDSWRRLAAYRENERLPHALLLTGPAGLGKLALARAFV